jgi:hypothetical protein
MVATANSIPAMLDDSGEVQIPWLSVLLHLCLGSLFTVVSSGLMVMLGLKPLGLWYQSANWVETPCMIQTTSIQLDRNAKALSYLPEVKYIYIWNGVSRQGTRFAWDEAGYSRLETVKKWMEPFKAGKPAICFVNPGNPQESVLVRSIPKPPLFVIPVTMFFLAIGMEMVLSVFRSAPAKKNSV